ncbi:VanZ family protein [Paenibacillus sp. 32O-W]|uniref:VanZ family protein n=1 Tax=Paenibacillus sp. 32O-W TaxID=1695218 RepID=UPI00078360A0|nr:VanZ family protein [Paenibacillus sp. 32O-W]
MSARNKIRIAGVVLFILYLYFLLHITLFTGHLLLQLKTGLPPMKLQPTIVHLMLTKSIGFILRNLVGNILLFVPFGFLIPIIFLSTQKKPGIEATAVIILGLLTTLTIEILQRFVALRIFDIDDIILNTIGVIIGYLIYRLSKLLIMRGFKTKEEC